MDDGHDKCEDEQVDICLEEGLLDAVLVLIVLLLAHQVAENIEPVSQLLGGVHLPLEHRDGLERDGEVEQRRAEENKLL